VSLLAAAGGLDIPAPPTGWTGLGGRAQFRSGSDDAFVEEEPEEKLGESMASRIERKALSCGRESVEKVPIFVISRIDFHPMLAARTAALPNLIEIHSRWKSPIDSQGFPRHMKHLTATLLRR
jgi:hypothetical protein